MTPPTARPRAGLLGLQLSRWWQVALDWVYPPRCAGCGRVDHRWCPLCEAELAALPLDISLRRGRSLTVASTGVHEGLLRDAIHALKFENAPELASTLAHRLKLALTHLNGSFDRVLPVPLHESRQRARGYNQSHLLASALAQDLGVSVPHGALSRTRDTPPQVGLSREQRWCNMRDAFQGDPAHLNGASVLLVDDVLTTGATLQACAHAARQAGARTTLGLTLSRARDVLN